MLFIGNSLAITGINEYCGYQISNDGQLTSEQLINFLSLPSESLNIFSDGSDSPNINNYLLTPLFLDSGVKLCLYERFTLIPHVCYAVSGQAGFNSKVYLSISNSNYDNFTKDFLYETDANQGIFDFNFDISNNQLYFEEETTIVIWTEVTDIMSMGSFITTLAPLNESEDLIITFYKHSAPEGHDDKLTIKGTTKNLYGTIYGTLIYSEDLLDDESRQNQNLAIQYFNKLENGQELTEVEWLSFRNILTIIKRGSAGIAENAYSIDLSAKDIADTEERVYVSDFYLWVEHEKTDMERVIQVNEKDGEGGHDGLDIQWVGCLAGDTPIIMADGTKKELQELQPNDWVLDMNGEKTRVLEVKRKAFDPSHALYFFENDIIIDVVGSHRFYNVEKGYWEHLYKWKLGEHALDFKGNKIKLLSKKKVFERKERFNLSTESGRYYANGLLSGPARCNRELLKDMTLKDAAKMLTTITSSQTLSLLDVGEII